MYPRAGNPTNNTTPCLVSCGTTHLDRNLPDALGGVCVGQDPSPPAGLRDLLDGLQRSNLAGRIKNSATDNRPSAVGSRTLQKKTKGCIQGHIEGSPREETNTYYTVGDRSASQYLAVVMNAELNGV